MHAQALTHAEIQHDFLASTRDRVGPNITVQPLNLTTLTTTAITETTKDLTGLTGTELKSGGGLRLQTGNGATQLEHGFSLVHRLALVDDVLQPVVCCLDLTGHVRQLHPNHGMVDEPLAEGAALVGILHRLFITHPGEPDTLDHNANTLVIEVGHDDCSNY